MKATYYILICAFIAGLISSCKKDDAEMKPAAQARESVSCASANFAFVDPFKVNGSITPSSLNFIVFPYYARFTARLNENIEWMITISGQTSGATKTYLGKGRVVDIKWYGTPDGGEAGGDLFFQSGEQVTISFTPACKAAVVVYATIVDRGTYAQYGTLLGDFDQVGSFYHYNNPYSGPWIRNLDTLLTNTSPQGGNCHKISAPAGHTGWYIGGFGSSCDLSLVLGTALTSDQTYLNAYIYGSSTPGTQNNAFITLDVVESRGGNMVHCRKSIAVKWQGWKMISYPLRTFGIVNPLHVVSVDFSVGPITYDAGIETYVDFVILTKGKPFLGPN